MLIEEAIWIGEELKKISKPNYKFLNIGSSNLKHRNIVQPHMNEYIFKPLCLKKVKIIHTDIKADEGVDLVGDLTDQNFINELYNETFDGIICTNLLEHIIDKKLIINTIDKVLKKGAYCLITVPYNYPYHIDPIDTMYRPRPEEIYKLFDGYELVSSECLTAKRVYKGKFQKNYFAMLKQNPNLFLRLIFRCFLPFYKYHKWKITIKDISKMFKDFQVSCVLIKKI